MYIVAYSQDSRRENDIVTKVQRAVAAIIGRGKSRHAHPVYVSADIRTGCSKVPGASRGRVT